MSEEDVKRMREFASIMQHVGGFYLDRGRLPSFHPAESAAHSVIGVVLCAIGDVAEELAKRGS